MNVKQHLQFPLEELSKDNCLFLLYTKDKDLISKDGYETEVHSEDCTICVTKPTLCEQKY